MKFDIDVITAIKLFTAASVLGMVVFTYLSVRVWLTFVANVAVSTLFCIAMLAVVLFADLCVLRGMVWVRRQIRMYYARNSRRTRKS